HSYISTLTLPEGTFGRSRTPRPGPGCPILLAIGVPERKEALVSERRMEYALPTCRSACVSEVRQPRFGGGVLSCRGPSTVEPVLERGAVDLHPLPPVCDLGRLGAVGEELGYLI